MSQIPVFSDDMGGGLLVPAEGESEGPHTVADCLNEAMMWLDAARGLTLRGGPPPTSLHVMATRGRGR